MSSKKAQMDTFGIIARIAIVLLIVVVSYAIYTQMTSKAFKSLNACNEYGYECLTVCDPSAGDEPYPAGNGACEFLSNGVCCKTEETEARLEQMQQGIIPPGSPRLRLSVSDKDVTYSSGDLIRALYTNKEYTFSIASQDFGDDADCSMQILHRGTDENVIEEEQASCEDFSMTTSFSTTLVGETLDLKAVVSSEDDNTMTATFRLDIQNAVRVRGLGEWEKEPVVRLDCLIGTCEQVTMSVIHNRDSTNCNSPDDALLEGYDRVTSQFSNRQAEFVVNEDMIGNDELVDGYACFNVETASGDTMWFTSDERVLVDKQAPEITGLDLETLELECDDGEGSGCAKYYYQLVDVKYPNDFDEITSLTQDWFTRMVTARNTCPGGYRGPFREPGIDAQGVVSAVVCAYAEDEAGNGGPQDFAILPYANEEAAQQAGLDWLIGQLG